MRTQMILICVMFACWGMAQTNRYVKEAEPAVLEVYYVREQVTDTIRRETKFDRRDEVLLRIGKKMSLFCGTKRLWRDSLMAVNTALFFEMNRVHFEKHPNEILGGRYWAYVYKNYPKGKVTECNYFNMMHWRYEEDWEKPQWEIGEETKEVLGYVCLSATTRYRGRTWTAWFAPDIPIEEGPWKLCGLPGLILEAYDAGHDYSFVAIGMRQNGLADVGFMTYDEKKLWNKVSRERYCQEWWRYRHSNVAAQIQAAYGVGTASNLSTQRKEVREDLEETDYNHQLK